MASSSVICRLVLPGHNALQLDNPLNDVPLSQWVVQQLCAAIDLPRRKRHFPGRDLHHRIQKTTIPDQSLPLDGIAIFGQKATQDFRTAVGLQQQGMPSVCRPRRTLQDPGNVLSAHTGNDDGIALVCRNVRKAVTKPVVHMAGAVESSGLSGPLERAGPQIRRNGCAHPSVGVQPHRQICVISPDIRQACSLRDPSRQKSQTGRQRKLPGASAGRMDQI